MIEKSFTTPTGAEALFHAVSRAEATAPLDALMVHVNSYASEATFLAGAGIVWASVVRVPTTDVAGSLVDHIEAWLIADPSSPFNGGAIVSDKSETLESVKSRKNAEITRDRIAADNDKFTYLGKQIKSANKDMLDLLVADARWSKGVPANWPGGWKAIDNSYVLISNKDAWDQFFVAMYDQGITNFMISQNLKQQIDAATTIDEVNAIGWPT